MSTFGFRPFSGLYNGQFVRDSEKWLGRPVDWVVLMADRTSIDAMKGSARGNLKNMAADSRSGAANKTLKVQRMDVVLTVPLAFARGTNAKTEQGQKTVRKLLKETAKGKWKASYERLIVNLLESGFPNAVIRLGHELNGKWYAWSAVGNAEPYIEAYRTVQAQMKSLAPKMRFEFNLAHKDMAEHGLPAYPGSDVVDIIGLDIYNKSNGGIPQPFDLKWATKLLPSLVEHFAFAKANRKPVSYAEWANGSLDEPMFIHKMADWFTSLPNSGPGGLYYQSYFNVRQKEYMLENYPKSRAAFHKRFGSEK